MPPPPPAVITRIWLRVTQISQASLLQGRLTYIKAGLETYRLCRQRGAQDQYRQIHRQVKRRVGAKKACPVCG